MGKGAPLFSGLVSKHNNKFIKEGFNLDLTYITTNVIGMSFPATKLIEK